MEDGAEVAFGFQPELLVSKSPISNSIPDCQALPQIRNPFLSLLGLLLSRPGGNALLSVSRGIPTLGVAMVIEVVRVSLFPPGSLRIAKPEAIPEL